MAGGRFWETRVDTPKHNEDCPLHGKTIAQSIIDTLPPEADKEHWMDRRTAAEMDLAGHRTNEQIDKMKQDFIARNNSAQSSSGPASRGGVSSSQRGGERGRRAGSRGGGGRGPGRRGGRGRGG